MTLPINVCNSGSDNQHISLKAAFVLLAVGLQKPSPKSKAKDHQDVLSKRLIIWRQGEINKLLRETRITHDQGRIGKLKASELPDRSKVFAKLVLEGQINSALRFLTETTSGGVLCLTDEVMSQLKQKHPNPQSAKLGPLLFGPIVDQYAESVYTEVNGEMVRQAALRTKGARGLSGVDANGFRRILACKSFKQLSTRLCEAIAIVTRTLCTQYIDPMTIEPLVANRLIPLDKRERAVRPIGVGAVLRAATCKYHLQLCKRQKSKIPKLCHNKDFRYFITEILVSVHSCKYFSFAATFASRTLQGQANRLKIPLLFAHCVEIIQY